MNLSIEFDQLLTSIVMDSRIGKDISITSPGYVRHLSSQLSPELKVIMARAWEVVCDHFRIAAPLAAESRVETAVLQCIKFQHQDDETTHAFTATVKKFCQKADVDELQLRRVRRALVQSAFANRR